MISLKLSSNDKFHYYIHTFCRYFVAIVFLMYAIAKLIGTQFYSPNITYDRPIGQLDGFQLTWFYFGYSKMYVTFIAFSQIATSLLLFNRKTTRFGILMFLSIIGNIVVMDFAYNIDAKSMALVLLILGLILFFYEVKHYLKFFFSDEYPFRTLNIHRFIRSIQKLKWLLLLIIVALIFLIFNQLKQNYFNKDELNGTWRFKSAEMQNKSINFEIGNNFIVFDYCNQKSETYGNYIISEGYLKLNSHKPGQNVLPFPEEKGSKGSYVSKVKFKIVRDKLWLYGTNKIYLLYKVR